MKRGQPTVRTPGNLSAIPPKPGAAGGKMPYPHTSPANPRGDASKPTTTKGT